MLLACFSLRNGAHLHGKTLGRAHKAEQHFGTQTDRAAEVSLASSCFPSQVWPIQTPTLASPSRACAPLSVSLCLSLSLSVSLCLSLSLCLSVSLSLSLSLPHSLTLSLPCCHLFRVTSSGRGRSSSPNSAPSWTQGSSSRMSWCARCSKSGKCHN